MKHIVGVADMKISNDPADTIVTFALGSCLGIVIHDPQAKAGGLLHAMLPGPGANDESAGKNPMMYIETGLPRLFKSAYAVGAEKRRLKVYVAGGATFGTDRQDFFAIGKRNLVLLRKMLWKNQVMITKEDVGGTLARTMSYHLETGRVWLQSNGREWDL